MAGWLLQARGGGEVARWQRRARLAHWRVVKGSAASDAGGAPGTRPATSLIVTGTRRHRTLAGPPYPAASRSSGAARHSAGGAEEGSKSGV